MTGFLKRLKYHRERGRLTRQQIQTLRGQALAGDISGANKGLDHILQRKDKA